MSAILRSRNARYFLLIFSIIVTSVWLLDAGRSHLAFGWKITSDYPPHKPVSPSFQVPRRGSIPPSKLLAHARGYNALENVYASNGTLYIVTDDQNTWPPLNLITSSGHKLAWSVEAKAAREPTEWDIAFLTTKEANTRWGNAILWVPDWTIYVNEPNQYNYHYYHWVGEIFLGIQRLYSSLDPNINVRGETVLPNPARMIFRHISHTEWNNWGPMNWHITLSVYPNMAVEFDSEWDRRKNMTRTNRSAWRFENMLVADRGASFRQERVPGRNHRTVWSVWEATQNTTSRWWWEVARRRVLRVANAEEQVIDVPSAWETWKGHFRGDYPPTGSDLQTIREAPKLAPVVITYISRQRSIRRLIVEDEKLFVQEMTVMASRRGWEFNHVFMQDLSVDERLQVAAKTTILIGVHGNGLTHLVWMPLTPLTTVIEIFFPGGFAKDYEWTSRALGMTHYAVWNDTAYTHPNEPKVDYPKGFQGIQIPIHGPSIAKVVEGRIDGKFVTTPKPKPKA